jgi:hypothetical protein
MAKEDFVREYDGSEEASRMADAATTKANARKPPVKLTGQDGNAFAILGLCQRAAKDAGWSQERRDEFMAEAQSGDYGHLLATAMRFFDVR